MGNEEGGTGGEGTCMTRREVQGKERREGGMKK